MELFCVINQIMIKKIEDITQDKAKFKPATNNIFKQLKKFQSFLFCLKKSGSINQELYNRIRPTSTSLPTLYGLLKIHWENTPLRPTLSFIGRYNHECAIWLPEILSPLHDHPSSLDDAFSFLNQIKDFICEKLCLMASLDVKSLFTTVPLDFTIELFLKNIFSQGTKDFNGLNKNQLKKLLSWTCKGTIFQFNGNTCEQIDGISMGSLIAPIMADVCMNWILNEVLTFKPQPCVLFRYVDDFFCVFNGKDELEQFMLKLIVCEHTIEKRIRKT